MNPPVFVAAFNAVGELSLLGRSGTVVFFDFSAPVVIVSGSALQLETCYGVVSLPYLFIFAKMAAFPVAAGLYSNMECVMTRQEQSSMSFLASLERN